MADLTVRELEVLTLLASGHSNKVIASKLDLTENTVKVYMRTIFSKTGTTTRVQAAVWALNNGILGEPPELPQPIRAVYGHEPRREGEEPTAFIVGRSILSSFPPLSEIRYRETSGLGWYDAYAGEARLASLSALAVAEVYYNQTQPKAQPQTKTPEEFL